MSIYEYDAEEHMRQEREAEYERGFDDGIETGIERGIEQGIERGKLQLIQKKLELGNPVSKIAEDLVESEETIRQLIKEHRLVYY